MAIERPDPRIRTEGVHNLVNAAIAAGVGRFVQESLGLTYPDSGDQWIMENASLHPADNCRTVLNAEKSVESFTAPGGVGVALRFAAFYGPDSSGVRGLINMARTGWAALPGGPHRFISSVCHDDAGRAVVAALRAPAGAYNVVDDEPVRLADYFAAIAPEVGAGKMHFPPKWTTPLCGAVGEALARSQRERDHAF